MSNEIPMDVRTSEVIVCALWFRKGKRNINVFLQAFVANINKISDLGISCTIQGEVRLVKPYTICCVDSAARAPMQGITQYNTFFWLQLVSPSRRMGTKRGEYWWLYNIYFFIIPMPEERNKQNMLKCMQLLVNPSYCENSSYVQIANLADAGIDPIYSNPSHPCSQQQQVLIRNLQNDSDDLSSTFGVKRVLTLINLKNFYIVWFCTRLYALRSFRYSFTICEILV